MPDLFEEYGALELDDSPQKPVPKPTEPERTGPSHRTRIVCAAAAAAAVVIAVIFGFAKYHADRSRQALAAQTAEEETYIHLCQAALERFRGSGAYHVTEDHNGSSGYYLYDGSRWLCWPSSGYIKLRLWVDGTEYAGNAAGSWSRSDTSPDDTVVPWLWDYEWSGSDNITLLSAEQTDSGQAVTLLMENDPYWQSIDSSYTVCFTLNSRDELAQISFAYTLPDSERIRTFTVEEADGEELAVTLDEIFTEAYLKSDSALAPLSLCLGAIYDLAKQESFHIQCEASRNTDGLNQTGFIGNAYWHGSRGASERHAVANGGQTLYSLALYQYGYTHYWQSGSNIVGSANSSGESTAFDLIADCLPQYDWLSDDLTLLATESTGTGVNILFLVEGEGVRTSVCFTLDNSYELVSITETDPAQTVTYRILSTDAGQIDSAIDRIAEDINANPPTS